MVVLLFAAIGINGILIHAVRPESINSGSCNAVNGYYGRHWSNDVYHSIFIFSRFSGPYTGTFTGLIDAGGNLVMTGVYGTYCLTLRNAVGGHWF